MPDGDMSKQLKIRRRPARLIACGLLLAVLAFLLPRTLPDSLDLERTHSPMKSSLLVAALAGVLPLLGGCDAASIGNKCSPWTPVGAEPSGAKALDALVRRRLPKKLQNAFTFVENTGAACAVTNATTEFDAFTVAAKNGKVTIKSCTTSGLSRGLLEYLRSIGGDIFWSGDTFAHNQLKIADAELDGGAWGSIRYFLNVVTYSYTTAFYQWDKWEYLLDWAALHGVNLPLAVGGQEYIWAEVLRDYGLSEDVILPYFSGPAFHSWQRMGNIHSSWGMNVTQGWLDAQWALQKKIVSRMLALGMTPVLPGFSGFVPQQLHDKIGGPAFIQASAWEAFPDAYTKNTALDPTWPTFHTVQQAFLKKQQQLYGGWTSHHYSIDLYNELTPSSNAPAYLSNVTSNVVSSLRAADDQAVWVMQGWLFASDPKTWTTPAMQAYLTVPDEKAMIVLDLASEILPVWNRTENFFGRQWVWNTLWDYGQNNGLNGNLEWFAEGVTAARKASPGTLLGTGITMEGMNQNEIVFEMAMDHVWKTSKIDVPSWTRDWVQRRYDLANNKAGAALAQDAWTHLLASAYNQTDPAVQAVSKSIFDLVPAPSGLVNRTGHHPTELPWNTTEVVVALDKLVAAADADHGLKSVDAFKYDIVDVARQVLLSAGIPVYQHMIAAWNTTTPNLDTVRAAGAQIVDLLNDVDAILGTDKNFLLSTWIKDARAWESDKTLQDFMEYQARNQIVLWGPANFDLWKLDRYASKDWHGVVSNVFAKSWEQFTTYLTQHPAATYNQSSWSHELQAFEAQWQTEIWGQRAGESWSATGDAVASIKKARKKWAALL
ncbi:hypothetical protein Q8F55_007535 [Vanrija albida]|uniref:Alpha-N-acetylglucosaminidase n=1 Tax=Vanrija albida TaxID=181172 RepID=A0ABR3PU17_9TREE